MIPLHQAKQLYWLHRIGSKRDPARNGKLLVRLFQYFNTVLFFVPVIIFSVIILLSARKENFDIYEPVMISLYAVFPVLALDFVLRLIAFNKDKDELPLLFSLPVPKKNIALFKTLYSATGPLVFSWTFIASLLYGAVAYLYLGGKGFMYAVLISFLTFTFNKQFAKTARAYFWQNKILITLLIIAFYVIPLFATLEIITEQLNISEYSKQLLMAYLYPTNKWVALMFLILLCGGTYICIRYYAKHLMKFKLDTIYTKNPAKAQKTIHLSLKGNSKVLTFFKKDLLYLFRSTTGIAIAITFPILFFFVYKFILSQPTEDGFRYTIGIATLFTFIPILITSVSAQISAQHLEFYFLKNSYLKYLLISQQLTTTLLSIILAFFIGISTYYRGLPLLPLIAIASFTPGLISWFTLYIYAFVNIPITDETKKTQNGGIYLPSFAFAVTIHTFILMLTMAIEEADRPEVGYSIIIIVNILIALSSPLWSQHIIKIMNKRKYKNLEKIRNSLH